MKTTISALAFGLVLAFSAPAFASTTGAYVGDMLSNGSSAKANSHSAENEPLARHHSKRHQS